MRAVLCKEFGSPTSPERVAIQDIPAPTQKPDEVIVSVRVAGISFPDVLLLQNKYQYTPTLPFTPGSELSGIIMSVGADVKGYKPGDAVIGKTKGSCAEEVAVPASKLWHLPAGVDFNSAAGFSGNYATSYYALKQRANLQPGETLLVLGASGGVGLAAVDLGRMMGARVIACASTAAKLDACKQAGADELINYETEDIYARAMQITGGKGVDVVYDPVGDRFAEPSVRSMGWNGRYLIVGFAAGAIPKISFMLPFEKRCALMGVWSGGYTQRFPRESYDNITELIAMLAAGKIRPHISGVYALENIGEAFRALANREVIGKVVITTGK